MNVGKHPPEEIERYKIDHPHEIERILSGVMTKKALVTAYGENNRDFVVTSLVAIDFPCKAVYFGIGPDPAMNQALVASEQVSFNTAHDQVRVLFTTPGLEMATLEGEPVLKAAMPTSLLRFQRREYYRLATSLVNPVKCLIDTDGKNIETTVVDISLGGVGVLAYAEAGALKVDQVHRGCKLVLPDAGIYLVSLHVRALYDPVVRNGVTMQRIGCQFIDLASSIETDIQRYIIRVERERRAGTI